MAHSTYTTKHAIRRLLLYNVYQNHAKTNVRWTHDPFDPTAKHAIRRLLLYIVYQNHAKNVWRTHDPFDLHTETQNIQSFCGTWCIKVMQKNAGGPIADSTSTNKMQNANFESRKQTRNWSATSARGARAKSGAHRCAWSANPAVALPFLLACVCV